MLQSFPSILLLLFFILALNPVLFEKQQKTFILFKHFLLEVRKFTLLYFILDSFRSQVSLRAMTGLDFDVVNVWIIILEGTTRFLWVDAAGVILKSKGIVNIINIKDTIDILPDYFKHFLQNW